MADMEDMAVAMEDMAEDMVEATDTEAAMEVVF